jgi:hypothetical protein
MARLIRMVEPEEWCLSSALDERRERLINVPNSVSLLENVIAEAEAAVRKDSIRIEWEPSYDSPGYFHLIAQIPLSPIVFDQLFNGRSGYRAQYYLSPEEGILYNRDILRALRPAIRGAYARRPRCVELELIEQSTEAPHSKIWVHQDKLAFNAAAQNTLNPPRWVKNHAALGCRAPLPDHCMIDVNGALIHPETGELFVNEAKLDRACDLFRCGFT